MRELRRKVLLPVFTLTEVCDKNDSRSIPRSIKRGISRDACIYHVRPVVDPIAGTGFNYNLLPIILNRQSVPWTLGTLFILSRLEGGSHANIATIHSIADDLGAYREWLDEHDNPDAFLLDFPKLKLRRPTYRYNGFLRNKINVREIAPSTAKRRMGTVVSFYRWMMKEGLFEPANDPWQERGYDLTFASRQGFSVTKQVKSTDLAINAPRSEDPFSGTIQDGGKLRPLSENEQRWC